MDNQKLREKLVKLQALATNNPNAEEAATAAQLLKKLMLDNGLTETDILEEITELRVILTGRADIHEIAVGVVQSEGLVCYSLPDKKRRDTCVAFYGTKIQEAELRNKINFYCEEYKRQKKQFVIAFMAKNKLFTPSDGSECNAPLSETDREIVNLAMGIKKSTYNKQIE